MKPKPKTLFLFTFGQIAVCDEAGQQIPELQNNALSTWAKDAEALGYEVDGLSLETHFGTGTLRKSEFGWSVELPPGAHWTPKPPAPYKTP